MNRVCHIGATVAFIVWPGLALAHVKWFAPYDIVSDPRSLAETWTPEFVAIAFGSSLLVFVFCLLERTVVGAALTDTLEWLFARFRSRTDDFYRGLTGAFFVALFTLGNIIMTPELRTTAAFVPWLQAAIAAGMFWNATRIFSALGILILYCVGVADYGIYHMLDYPIFLGIAVYHALTSLKSNFFKLRPLDCSRWLAAITLMWASIEKWAYPQWSYALLQTHSDITFGISPSQYMILAGFVEFSLAFGLIWTPLVRRLSALVLTVTFVSAVIDFGRVDAIGHLLIVLILVFVAADDGPAIERRPLSVIFLYFGALAFFFDIYYGIHWLSYDTAGLALVDHVTSAISGAVRAVHLSL